jgi:hypothetical protein
MTSDFKWGIMIVACMRRLRDSGECVVPFVDCEVLPHFDGSPDDIFAWFICNDGVANERFRAEALMDPTRRRCAMAIEAGFPRESTDTLRTDVTSEEDIEAGGGRFAFFR